MMDQIVYVHYGSAKFVSDWFTPIRNGDWRPKPADGTGLWASREADEWGWEAWCRNNHFNLQALKQSFKFTLAEGSNIITLTDPEQLIALPKVHPWEPKDLSWIETIAPGQMPSMEQLESFYAPNWCCLDFEKLAADGVDAIELRNSGAFKDSLDTWDCDCIVVMNPDVIEEV